MFHRHLSAEAYERALEEDPESAAEMMRSGAACGVCAEATTSSFALASAMTAWTLPSGSETSLDWHTALAHAIAPTRRPDHPRWRPLRLLLTISALIVLLAALAVPAAASSGPGSVLYPVRGATDEVRWRATPRSEQPRLEAELTASYLWEARVSAGRGDRAAYRAAMGRVFTWSDRLRTDFAKSAAAERPQIRASVSAARSLVAPIQASSVDENQAGQVDSVLNDVQGESQQGDGEHSGGG